MKVGYTYFTRLSVTHSTQYSLSIKHFTIFRERPNSKAVHHVRSAACSTTVESIGCSNCTLDSAAVAWRARRRPVCCRLRGGYPGVFPNNTTPYPPIMTVTAIRTNTCLSGTAHTAWRTGGNGRHRCAQTPAAPPAS